jgi:hypothetical protein
MQIAATYSLLNFVFKKNLLNLVEPQLGADPDDEFVVHSTLCVQENQKPVPG